MILRKIELYNIRSYSHAHVDFPEGSTLLSGDIGAGKSSILLALEFALFGLQKGALTGAGLLRQGTNTGKVEVEFSIGENDVKITRTLKRGKSVTQDTAMISINGKEEEVSANELKQKVLQLLNYPPELLTKTNLLYRFTVYTPQEEMKQILLESAEERINTLRRVFGIERYKNISENIPLILSRIRENIRKKDALSSDMEKKKADFEKKKEEIEELEKKLKQIRELHEESKKKVERARNEVESIEVSIQAFNNLKTQISSRRAEYDAVKNQIQNIEFEILKIKKEIQSKPGTERDFKTELAEREEKIKKLEFEIEETDKKILEKEKHLAILESKKKEFDISNILNLKICPVCKQDVTDSHKEHLKQDAEVKKQEIMKSIKEFEAQKVALREIKNKSRESLDAERAAQKALNQKILKEAGVIEKINQLDNLTNSKKSSERKLEMINNEVSELNLRINKLLNIDAKYSEARFLLDKAVKEERDIAIEERGINENLMSINNLKSMLEKEITKKEILRQDMAYLKQLILWIQEHFLILVNRIEKNVLVTVHHEFSELFEKWFSMLTEQLSARLDEDFTPIIEQQGYEISYDFLSGGERTAAALSYRLALNQVINSLMSHLNTKDLLILDEPTDGFSSNQIEKMRDIMQDLKVKQLILVSHESEIESFVQNIIRFEKKQGITKIFR
jgi:exonuclease SbcC